MTYRVLSRRATLYVDRSLKESIAADVLVQLEREGITSREDVRVSFCGLVLTEHHTAVFLPRSANAEAVPPELKAAHAARMLWALEKYARDKPFRVNVSDQGEGRHGMAQLSLGLEILHDYLQNGLYSRRTTNRSVNSGRPDWRRTLSRSPVMVGRSGRPAYLTVECTRRQYTASSTVAAIQARIVHDLDCSFGWIVSGRASLIAPELLACLSHPLPVSQQVRILRSELRDTYSDADTRLLTLLIKYLAKDTGESASSFVAGVREFEFAWEHMLAKVLPYTVDLNSSLPFPVYVRQNGESVKAPERRMRTDIVLEDESTIAVVDAKYYEASTAANAPSWADIVKQFFYEKAVRVIRPSSSVQNVFLFPAKYGHFQHVTLMSPGRDTTHDDIFPPVKCVYVCPLDVVEAYVEGRKMHGLARQLLGS